MLSVACIAGDGSLHDSCAVEAAPKWSVMKAISIRQRKQRQQERLAWLKSQLQEVETRTAEAGRQAKLVQASCKAARRLMRTQNDHLTIACSRLEASTAILTYLYLNSHILKSYPVVLRSSLYRNACHLS